MEQQPIMQNQANPKMAPMANYPQQPPNMHPLQQNLSQADNKLQDSQNQHFYQQQQPNPAMPPKSYVPYNSGTEFPNTPSVNNNSYNLNSQMSNLTLDGETNSVGSNVQKPVSYQNVPNSYINTPPTFTGHPNQSFNPPTSQMSPNQPSIQPVPSQQVQSPQYDYATNANNQNFNSFSQQQSQPNNWNQNAYPPPPPPVKPGQHPPPIANLPQQNINYNNLDQQQNGRVQNFPPQSSYGSYPQQQQQPYQQHAMNQGFNSGQVSPNRFPYPSGGHAGQFGSANQQNKLDPEAMPSVVQVILEDKSKYETNNNVIFTTAIPATVPPLVTTIMENDNQTVEDGGSARPLFIRPTIYQVPVAEDNLKTSDIPFGIVMKPFDELEVEGKIVIFSIFFLFFY